MSGALPFETPATNAVPNETIPGQLPSEPYYRPRRRITAALRLLPLTVALMTSAFLIPRYSMLVVPTMAIVVLGAFILQRRSVPKMVKKNDEATALLAAGRVEEAANDFEALCRESRSVPVLHALFIFNRAVSYHQQSQLERALSLLAAVQASGWAKTRHIPNFHGLLLAEAAICLALLGRLEDADRLARRAVEHIGEPQRGKVLPAEVIIQLRSGRAAEAARTIAAQYFLAEGTLGARGARAMRVLWAYAITLDPAAAAGVDPERLLAGAYPHGVGEFDHLASAWPELQSFLRAHGLIG